MDEHLVSNKIPFDPELFFGAAESLLGKPVKKITRETYYDYFWKTPDDKQAQKDFFTNVERIKKWIKLFEIEFPESRCDVAKWAECPDQSVPYFRVTVSPPS